MAPDEPSSIVSDSPEPSADPPQHRETPIGGEAAETDSSTTSRAAAAPEATPKLQDKRATPAAPAMPDAGPPTARRANTFSTPPPTAQHERSDATKPAPQESGVAAPSGPGSALSAAPGRRSSDDERSASRRELAAGGAPALKALEAEPRGAAEWIARIRLLHAEGRLAEAKEELGRFRAAFDDADARLPAELRAWAGSLR